MRSSSGDEQESPRTNRHWDECTLNFIYEHTKEGPNLQFEDSKQLDTKITAVFAAATAAIGFAARLPNTRRPDIGYEVASWSWHINAVDLLFYLAVVAWGGVTVVTLTHLTAVLISVDLAVGSRRGRTSSRHLRS